MLVSTEHRFIFVHIPKTGGSSITKALAPFVSADHCDPNPRFEGPKWQTTWHFQSKLHVPLSDMAEELSAHQIDIKRYRVCTTMRNPYTWVYSFYMNMFRGRTDKRSEEYRHFAREDSFSSYCAYIYDLFQRGETRLWGNVPQVQFASHPDRPIPDIICKFETLEEDFTRMLRRLGIDDPPQLGHELNRPHRKGAVAEVYSPDEIAIVNEVFAEDFEVGGYEMIEP